MHCNGVLLCRVLRIEGDRRGKDVSQFLQYGVRNLGHFGGDDYYILLNDRIYVHIGHVYVCSVQKDRRRKDKRKNTTLCLL